MFFHDILFHKTLTVRLSKLMDCCALQDEQHASDIA